MSCRWSGQGAFNEAVDTVWQHPTTSKNLGEVRSANNLTFVRLYGAGNRAARDQPEASVLMMEEWLKGWLMRAGEEENPQTLDQARSALLEQFSARTREAEEKD